MGTVSLDSAASKEKVTAGSKMKTNGLEHPSALDDDPVCIVGMGTCLPTCPCMAFNKTLIPFKSQVADCLVAFGLWETLIQKKSAQTRVPKDRFNVEGYYNADGDRHGVIDVDGGYYIDEDVRQFENRFFGINNIEATYMDPQQRKLLEVVFECLEDAGVSMTQASGSNTGVYVGSFTHDYYLMQMGDLDFLHRYHWSGSGATILANRISHVFNLQGPR
jgi:hypothetical protein